MIKGIVASVVASLLFGAIYYLSPFLAPLDGEQIFGWRVLMIRRIRGLLYDEGFTIQGARSQLQKGVATFSGNADHSAHVESTVDAVGPPPCKDPAPLLQDLGAVRQELFEIQLILSGS